MEIRRQLISLHHPAAIADHLTASRSVQQKQEDWQMNRSWSTKHFRRQENLQFFLQTPRNIFPPSAKNPRMNPPDSLTLVRQTPCQHNLHAIAQA